MLPDGRLEEGKEYKMRNASSLPEKVRRKEKSLIFRLIDEE
jgi:hypothetical protein